MTASELSPLNEMGIFPVTDPEITQCVTYICNLAFSDVLDTCKNAKFPGGLAVSLSRDMLPRLHGHRSHHLPYQPTDILSWLSPTERVIPPMQLPRGPHERSDNVSRLGLGGSHRGGATAGGAVRAFKTARDEGPVSVHLEVHQLDFGAETGLFEVMPVMCVCASSLDFGCEDGLFRIV